MSAGQRLKSENAWSPEFLQTLMRINEEIADADAHLRDIHVEVASGELRWGPTPSGHWRIIMDDRPLVEQRVPMRVRGHRDLGGLISAVIAHDPGVPA